MAAEPLVSVCVPTYNGGRFIEAALASVTAQSYDNLEIVVVDDGSSDDTVTRIKRWGDPRMRVFARTRNRGHNATWNETVLRARGPYLKFLHQDDRLDPDCVQRMVDVIVREPGIGLVFCRRGLEIEGLDADDEAEFRAVNGRLDAKIDGLGERMSGPELFRQWFAGGYSANWIGEPSAVLVRRECVAQVGAFAHHIAQATDIELWMRILARFDAGFIPDELAIFHVGPSSLSTRNRMANAAWLDRLWTLECLAYDRKVARAHPALVAALRDHRHQSVRAALRLGHLGDGTQVPIGRYASYLRYRAAGLVGRTAPFAVLPAAP